MENYNVKEENGILVKEKIDKNMMNLHCKSFLELNREELQREIDYLWGQYDFVSQCEELPSDYKEKRARYIWNEIDALTTRLLLVNMKSNMETMENLEKIISNNR